MARSSSRHKHLQCDSEIGDNTNTSRRQLLADLIGRLLARYWLKMQETKVGNLPNDHATEPAARKPGNARSPAT